MKQFNIDLVIDS